MIWTNWIVPTKDYWNPCEDAVCVSVANPVFHFPSTALLIIHLFNRIIISSSNDETAVVS